ncbi:MAG: septum formation initiator family protein [Acidobacteria bacterium]|nr:septum formation initiator family protein [Acidobacteriota bacterium]
MRASFIKSAFAAGILVVVGYAFFTLRGPHGIPALMEKRQEIQQLEKRNGDLAREIELKRDRIDRLRESQSEQELEIRQRLKLVRPGEKVFILQEQDAKPTP